MTRIQLRTGCLALAAIIAVAHTSPAQAGWGSLIVRGIAYSLSPTIGTAQNGPNTNQNFFSQRYGIDWLGNGRSYEFTRYFGADTYGQPDQINLGLVNLQLGAPPGSGLLGAGVYNRVGYNLRLVPEVYFQSISVGRNQANLTGTQAARSPIQYNLEINNGVESLTFQGALSYISTGTVNALGFYSINFTASNTGSVAAAGALGTDTKSTDFDMGPVNLSGNIWVDMALAGIRYVGEQIGLPPELLPKQPARIKSPDEIARAIADGQPITMDDLGGILMLMHASPGEMAQIAQLPLGLTAPIGPEGGFHLVPEPGSAALLLLAGLMLHRGRRARATARD